MVALQCNSSWRGDDDLGQLENTAGGLATRKVMVAMTIKGPATIVVAFVLLLFPASLAEVLGKPEGYVTVRINPGQVGRKKTYVTVSTEW